jgi:SNF2 family DNA or RNA helicase
MTGGSAIAASSALKPLWPDGFAYKQHQTTGIKWMMERELSQPAGGILCDEMGLGKTIQMLGLLKQCGKQETLLLAPVAVLQQWEDAARKSRIAVFRPRVGTRTVHWEAVTPVIPGAARLHIIGYESARAHRELVISHAWDRVICDEAHRVASKSGLRVLVQKVEAPRRWMLTATPIVNGLDDLKALLEHVGAPSSDLVKLVPQYILARSMDDLRATIADAPPKPVEKTLRLPFKTEDEAEFYRGMTGLIVKRWKALELDGGGAGTALMKLQLFMRLRQLSLHPQVYIAARRKALGSIYGRADWDGSSTKFEAIKELIRNSDRPHRWIIFSHFHPEMELLTTALKAEPSVRHVWSYSGALSAGQRKEVLAATHEPLEGGSQVLLVQLQSGGTGLNLQHFDRVVFTGPWWTSALMEQAVGRAVRIGQREVVEVYHLVLEEEEAINIDAVMREKAEEKGGLCRAVLEAACREI